MKSNLKSNSKSNSNNNPKSITRSNADTAESSTGNTKIITGNAKNGTKTIAAKLAFILAMLLLMAAAPPMPAQASSGAAPWSTGTSINLDDFNGDAWNGGNGTSWNYSFAGQNHRFNITGQTTVTGSADLSHTSLFQITNSSATLIWDAALMTTPSSLGVAVSVNIGGRFEMAGGSIVTNGSTALNLAGGGTAVIYAGGAIAANGQSANAVLVSGTRQALVNEAASITGSLAAENGHGRAALITYRDGSHVAGESRGLALTGNGPDTDGIGYEWAAENGRSGVLTLIPAPHPSGTRTFIPVAGVTVSAPAGNMASISVSKPPNSNVSLLGREFRAYRILDYREGGTPGGSFEAADGFRAFANFPGSGTVGLAEHVQRLAGDPQGLEALAANLWRHIASNGVAAAGTQTATSDGGVTIGGLMQGYYLVHSLPTSGSPFVSSPLLVAATPDASITLKATDTPAIERRAWNGQMNGWMEWASAGIGGTVDFRIASAVPNVSGYAPHTFTVHERLERGLAYNAGSLVVTAGGTRLAEGAHYAVSENPGGGERRFSVIFAPAMFSSLSPGDAIEIAYSATLTEAAAVGFPGNIGETYLEHGSDPLDATATAETARSATAVFTFDLDIMKYTGTIGVDAVSLEGAEFELRADPADPSTAIRLILQSGGSGADRAVYRPALPAETGSTVSMATPSSGMIHARGLNVGIYYLVETKAPPGYNMLPSPVRLEIAHDDGSGTAGLTIDGTAGARRAVNVQNNAGATLPTLPDTGGRGAAVFFMAGLPAMAAGIALLAYAGRASLKAGAGSGRKGVADAEPDEKTNPDAFCRGNARRGACGPALPCRKRGNQRAEPVAGNPASR